MKKIVIIVSVVLIALTALTAAPVKNHGAARCIKKYMERKYRGRYQNIRISCKNGTPVARYYDRRYRKRSGGYVFMGSLGVKLKRVCANPCR